MSCGGGTSADRMLVSISITPGVATTTADGRIQFVATGTFSAPPVTVSPLPVNWSGSWSGAPVWCDPDGCAGMNPQGLAICFAHTPGVTITASAPRDPKLPVDTKNVPMVSGTATLNCE